MADSDKKIPSSALPADEDARANAIEERIARLRKLHGWASDTRTVSAEEVKAVVVAVDGERQPSPAGQTQLVLRYSYGGKGKEVVEITGDHHDIGSGEQAKLRILDASVAARHCRISRDGAGFRVRDMNSQTGTWVNDERVPLSSPIVDGDTLRCGEVEFAVSILSPEEAPPAASEAAPVAAPAQVPVAPPSTRQSHVPRPLSSPTMAQVAAREDLPAEEAPAGQAAPAARERITGPPSACFVVYFNADGQECEAEIPLDRPLIVGRRSTADMSITDHGISGLHAAFEWVEGTVVVRDLGSTNGTWVHGERVPRAVLADQEVVRLGLVPLRVRFVAEAPAVPVRAPVAEPVVELEEAEAMDEPAAMPVNEPAEAPAAAPVETGRAVWHLVFVTDEGAVAGRTMDERESCVVAGEGPAEISAHGRGLKPEHLQFDWTDAGLEVMQARRDALLKVNGKTVTSASLHGGDVVAAGSLTIRVVRLTPGPASQPPSQTSERWARYFRSVDPQLELLFVDPEAAGGRAELSIWGDGAAQVEQHSGASSERHGANLEPDFLRVLFQAIAEAGFPDVPPASRGRVGAGPELNSFRAEERADVALSDGLAATAPRWRVVRDLLRAVVDCILLG